MSQLDLLLPPVNGTAAEFSLNRLTPTGAKGPARWEIRNERGKVVGALWSAGGSCVNWYTRRGAGTARTSRDAFAAVKAKLGAA